MFDELSTNRHSSVISPIYSKKSSAHPEFSFGDANLVILCGNTCFMAHQGILGRHSKPLADLIDQAREESSSPDVTEAQFISLPDSSDDMLCFLQALYDGLYGISYGPTNFKHVTSILYMSNKYEVQHLRDETLRGLAMTWPETLRAWDAREAEATHDNGVYEPRKFFPHPILVINLARRINAPQVLPAAFYDLSRSSPSDIANGYNCPITNAVHHLSEADLLSTLRGREHGSRFLSTFIVNELEGREPTTTCLFRHDPDPHRRRTCQTAFETVTFEILRDVNGVVCQRSADPLFAILDSELLQSKDRNSPGPTFRTCENCRAEFGLLVDQARTELWARLPEWFGIENKEEGM